MAYGQTFPRWRVAAGDHWASYTEHAFVAGLGDGTLPRAAFLHYLAQDYVFLTHFSRAWALAVTKADSLSEMRLAGGILHALITEEMPLHVRTCAGHGIDEAALFATEERVENLAYTRFVLEAGHAGDFLDLMAALAPCVLGYGEIGARLMPKAGQTPYREWIEAYGGAGYQGVCVSVGALIDEAVESRIGAAPETSPRWASLCRTFRTATRLEAGFWDMGLTP